MKRRTLLASLFSSAAVLLAASLPLGAGASAATDPKAFIEGLAQRAIDSLTATDLPKPERIKRFRVLFRDHFAVKGIGKWVLGRYWKAATDQQKDEYLGLFEDLMVVSYVDRFATYAGEQLAVVKSLPDSETVSTVFSEIRRPGAGQPIRIDWRVSSTKDGGYKIVDVLVEGTSMSTTLRSDFNSLIRQNGGQVAGLLVALREKTAVLKAEAQTN